MKEAATFLSWAVSCSQKWVVVCLSLEHKGWDPSSCPQAVIFSSAPGGQLFPQEPGWALSVVPETKAFTYTFLARLITFYLKLKFSNSESPISIRPKSAFDKLQEYSDSEWKNRMSLDCGHGSWRQSRGREEESSDVSCPHSLSNLSTRSSPNTTFGLLTSRLTHSAPAVKRNWSYF